MAQMPSHHNMASDTSFSSYLVILKIHGTAIRLFDSPPGGPTQMTHESGHRIFCHDLGAPRDKLGSGVQVFLLDKSATTTEARLFRNQQPPGQELSPADSAIFMTHPLDSARKASYAIDIGARRRTTSTQDSLGGDYEKLGTAYIYLEPKFSTQGIQRMQVLSPRTKQTIGQIQVEYLVVTNPSGYGVKAERPGWLSQVGQLDAGHRGAGSGCRADLKGSPVTENTVASFNFAARHGADACELDVMCTADGVPVVYHNYMLNTSKPTQIDELTLEELQSLKDCELHDQGCKHRAGEPHIQAAGRENRPFPTLEEVLREVDQSCAFNVELKWAQVLSDGKNEATHYREINDFVDRILACLRSFANGRRILLSTLNADIAIMLRLKQTDYPVLFLTTGDSQRFNDPATKSVKNAIHFAQAFDLAGINPNAKWLNEYLVSYAKERGLLLYAWGEIGSARAVRELRRLGLDGVIYDKIDLIKPRD